ncbi:mitochondrial 2-oxoglutarate/malate carrier protein-like [Drosophila ficusphila]|uniref:mitochondrial 2-oxoglutarate/malate carrier protein-like n=1 Tax=Drosophila ficusphila TaxID=30025 RepID=UPI001C8A69AB|nr:mitochondrial 2-oxoglutarate/malate carrier protein-like [Drosophila ficusphila]
MTVNVDKKHIPYYVKPIKHGLGGMMATVILQPLDFIKTQMQLAIKGEYKSSRDCLTKVVKNEGIRALYKGLSAGLMRQVTYPTARNGFADMWIHYYRKQYNAGPTHWERMGIIGLGSAFGAMIANPAEVAMIRMMSDNRLPLEERRNYKNVVDAFARIVKEEGVLVLWRGCMPNMGRSMVVYMLQFGVYSKSWRVSSEYFSGRLPRQISSAMLTSVVTTMASMPLDMAKTRIQQQMTGEYKDTFDVLMKVSKSEGIFALWKGFTPHLLRRGLHIVFAGIFFDQLTKAYKRYVLGDD